MTIIKGQIPFFMFLLWISCFCILMPEHKSKSIGFFFSVKPLKSSKVSNPRSELFCLLIFTLSYLSTLDPCQTFYLFFYLFLPADSLLLQSII